MNNIPTDSIKEIAEQIDCGFRAYIHKTTLALLFIPDEDNIVDVDFDFWSEELEQLENNHSDYIEVNKWSSSEVFKSMQEFSELVSDAKHQNRLFDALRKNKPFREFNFVIDHSGDLRQEWFDFKKKWQMDFVAKRLNSL